MKATILLLALGLAAASAQNQPQPQPWPYGPYDQLRHPHIPQARLPAEPASYTLDQLPSPGATNAALPLLTISAADILPRSVHLWRLSTNQTSTSQCLVSFHFNEAGSNRVRAFTQAHANQTVRFKIGSYQSRPFLCNHSGGAGLDSLFGLSEAETNSILDTLNKPVR